MTQCIFCRIAGKEIPASIVYEDDRILAFRDADPQAPVHVLIIPKKHLSSLNDLSDGDRELMGHLMCTLPHIARKLELDNGYRLVCNCGEDGMQTVPHLHFHMLGMRRMHWPPG